MIGYNIKYVNDLIEDLEKSYKDVKSAMEDPWDAMTTKLRTEWIGPDEVANEQAVEQSVQNVYKNVKEVLNEMGKKIKEWGDDWKKFQQNNVMESTGSIKVEKGDISKLKEIDAIKLSDSELSIKVKDGSWSEDTKLGLASDQSATKVGEALDTYASTVNKSVKTLYSKINSSQAFVGGGQKGNMEKFIQAGADAVNALVATIKTIKEGLQATAANVKTGGAVAMAENIASNAESLAGNATKN